MKRNTSWNLFVELSSYSGRGQLGAIRVYQIWNEKVIAQETAKRVIYSSRIVEEMHGVCRPSQKIDLRSANISQDARPTHKLR